VFGYDLAGNLTSVNSPGGNISIQYDDRNLITAVNGGAGASAYAYDAAGRLVQRTDAAGTSSFTWTPTNQLASATDPVTGITQSYRRDAAGEVIGVTYGTAPAPTRSLAYDGLGRPVSDTLKGASGAVLTSYSYGYDANGNVTSESIQLPGNDMSGRHTFTYDYSDRLSSWAAPDGTLTSYAYDASGNRIRDGGRRFTFDQRNRITTGPGRTYTWSARDTLNSVQQGGGRTSTYTFDALGQLAKVDGTAYTYDGLDRIATRNGQRFIYAGTSTKPVVDDSATYARSSGGDILAVQTPTGSALVGNDRHGDLSYLFTGAGSVTDTTVYTPFGDPVSKTGNNTVDAGFQGDYTDPTTGRVLMGSRWYGADVATFISADTQFGILGSPISLNRYTYANEDPLRYFDPNGHFSFDPVGFASGVVAGIAGAVGNAVGTAGNVVGAVGDVAGNVVSTVGNALSGAVNTAGQAASNVIQTGLSIASTLARGTVQVASQAVQAVQAGWNTVVKGANAVWNGVTNAASAAFNWTAAQAGEFWTGLVSGTTELVQGLWSTVVLAGQCVTLQAACGETLGAIATAITTDPGKFFGSLIDWEDLSHGRIARWLGHLAPSIVSLVVTKGAANAISKAGVVAKVSEAVGGTGRAAAALAKTGITRAANSIAGGAEAAIAKAGGAFVGVTRSGIPTVERSLLANAAAREAVGTAGPRAAALQDLLPAASRGRVTMGVGVGQDANGVLRTVIGTSERGGYLRAPVAAAIRNGEEIAGGTGHAEQNIIAFMEENGINPIEVAAGRPICTVCAETIQHAGGGFGSPLR
jgi:RHS repeat-associated protein